jgi:hypothetical protein
MAEPTPITTNDNSAPMFAMPTAGFQVAVERIKSPRVGITCAFDSDIGLPFLIMTGLNNDGSKAPGEPFHWFPCRFAAIDLPRPPEQIKG